MSTTLSNLGRISFLAASLGLVAALSGCAQNDSSNQSAEKSVATASLANTYWKLIELNQQAVTMQVNQEREQHIIFHSKDKRFTGFAGCNGYFGQYEIDGAISTSTKVATTGNLSLSGIGATRMACPDVMINEQKFLSAVSESTTFTIAGETLILSDEKDAAVAKFKSVYL